MDVEKIRCNCTDFNSFSPVFNHNPQKNSRKELSFMKKLNMQVCSRILLFMWFFVHHLSQETEKINCLYLHKKLHHIIEFESDGNDFISKA